MVNASITPKSIPATHNGVNAEIDTGNAIVAVHKYMIKAVRA